MEIIGKQEIMSFNPSSGAIMNRSCAGIRKGGAVRVKNFMDLARKVAELQFMNRDFVLLFRGQGSDHKNSANLTSLRPSIFRSSDPKKIPTEKTLHARFNKLEKAEQLLSYLYGAFRKTGSERLKRQKILRWSILQHYEVCPTPLLDVTHSLRVAASFASENATSDAYIFVLGVPNMSGAITASAEAGLQIIRLSSVCPPTALRPHIQEGYLLGEYPEIVGVKQKQHYKTFEVDFGRRLVAKFCFDPTTFWKKDSFSRIDKNALYPNTKDPIFSTTKFIKDKLAGP